MIIDVIIMDMVQVTIMDIVHMVPVADHQMPILGAVHMVCMNRSVHRRFAIWIDRTDFNHMLIDMIAMDEMQMPIMQIVPVIIVPDPLMPAAFAMLVRMIRVNFSSMIPWGHRAGAEPGK